MNEVEKKEPINKDANLAEVDSFNQAISAKNAAIKKRDETIAYLKNQLGEREITIADYVEKLDQEKALRIEAEDKIVDKSELNKKAIYTKPKSEEEKFAERYLAISKSLREKNPNR